jgi:3-methyladenine DNA glycosylase Tag
MHPHEQPSRPTALSGYLAPMARVMFSTGISWRVVDAKWPDIEAAFDGFDPVRVAGLSDADIDRLMGDPRVIRNRRKLEAIRANAARLVELDATYGRFDRYLDSLGDYDATRKALRKQFAFLGDSGTWLFLWMVGRSVPEHEGSR